MSIMFGSLQDAIAEHERCFPPGIQRYEFETSVPIRRYVTFDQDSEFVRESDLDFARRRAYNMSLRRLIEKNFIVCRLIEYADEMDGTFYLRLIVEAA